jgi:hypothetical protein
VRIGASDLLSGVGGPLPETVAAQYSCDIVGSADWLSPATSRFPLCTRCGRWPAYINDAAPVGGGQMLVL